MSTPRVARTNTPWGIIDHITKMAPGIWSVSTPSHGGFILDDAHAELIPDSIKPFTGDKHYWEEDFDYMVPLLFFQPEIEPNTPFDGWAEAEQLLKKEKPEWHNAILFEILTKKQERKANKCADSTKSH